VGHLQRTSAPASSHARTDVVQHAFHFHCISRWLKTRNVCPLDNREWELQKCVVLCHITDVSANLGGADTATENVRLFVALFILLSRPCNVYSIRILT
jgi:ribosome biogenesis protein Nip4